MQIPKVNYVAESTIIPMINAVEKTVAKTAQSAQKMIKPTVVGSEVVVPIKKLSTMIDPNTSYALSHGNVAPSGVGAKLYRFV